jgi:UDP-2,4-diacetamido-2,4,6-trideoxy-beta-L-altropyranose hydrolase
MTAAARKSMAGADAVFRFDAAPRIGIGHAIRSRAIASTLRSVGWTIVECVNADADTVVDFAEPPLSVGDGDEAAVLRDRLPAGCDLCFVDHYGRSDVDERALRPWARRIVVLDDRATRRHDCDVLIDPTPMRASDAYIDLVPRHARRCLGPSYAPLRPGFLAGRAPALARRAGGVVGRILVAVSGTDPTDATSLFLDALDRVATRAAIDVVLGRAAPALDKLRARAAAGRFRLHVDIDATAMARLMTEADLALGAPSSAAWERCCLGLPCIVVTTADNQLDVARALSETGAGWSLGPQSQTDAEAIAVRIEAALADGAWRAEAARRAARLCDGRGSWRIACAVLGEAVTTRGASVRLRPADDEDRDRILAWNLEPGTRRYFRNPAPPSPPEHAAWFAKAASFADTLLFIAECDGAPAGVLRLDRDEPRDAQTEVSLIVAGAFRGRGLAPRMLELAQRLLRHAPLAAQVDPRNAPSMRAFLAAGFRATTGDWYEWVPTR